MNHPISGPTKGVRIAGTGMAVPERVLTNEDVATMVDTSDGWISQRTGIKSRHIVEDDTTVRDLAVQALKQALDSAGIEADQLDLVILATLTPEMVCPATATRVVAEIGAAPAGGMDLSAACSGFVYGLNVAASLMQTGHYRHIAVVGSELLSKIIDWQDRRSCVLFGDGAGAAILAAAQDEGPGCLYQSMSSNGNGWEFLYCPRSERDLPPDANGFSGKYNTLQMNGREVYKFAVSTLQDTIVKAVQGAGIELEDLAMIIPHQSNQRILESARERLGLTPDKLYTNIERYGNTSAASIPICLHELTASGRIRTGDLILLVGLGGGLTWASSVWRL